MEQLKRFRHTGDITTKNLDLNSKKTNNIALNFSPLNLDYLKRGRNEGLAVCPQTAYLTFTVFVKKLSDHRRVDY